MPQKINARTDDEAYRAIESQRLSGRPADPDFYRMNPMQAKAGLSRALRQDRDKARRARMVAKQLSDFAKIRK